VRQAQYWQRVHHRDPRALALADRHYSRRTPGSPEFVGPGHKVVLLHTAADGRPLALWASHRCAPASGIKRGDGLDAWDCVMFRNEGASVPASELIREAVSITLACWGDVPPLDGFITTINPRKVEPIKRRGVEVWGYCYIKAGWTAMEYRTRARGLVILRLTLDDVLAHGPAHAFYYDHTQLRLDVL
jgi:hypothetical protein